MDAILPELLEKLHEAASVVLEAAPGAGKTTRVPPALLEVVAGEVVVLEPRRIAARMAARRVAQEMGERAGERVGYQVRFEDVTGPRTRLRFVTEGVLTRRLITDPELKGVDAVVLDEFHERHLDTDLALALLKRLRKRRPGLKLVVMSATLDVRPVADFLRGCAVVRSEGRMYPLTVTNMPYSPEPLEKQVRKAVEALLAEGWTGDVLTFLPGAAEIRRAMRECSDAARRAEMLVLPLHGSLSPEEQDRAVSPAEKRKLILSTNVAESSITVEGVTAVIDSGLARVATWSPWTGLPTLHVARVSQASAKQRAGRAGRTGPGRVVRLYPAEDFQLRPEFDAPEMLRSDLSQLCLALRAMGVEDARELDWLEAPPEPAVEAAERLLDRLGATGYLAQRLIRMPLPPRLARVVVEAMERGVGEDGCVVAAMLGAGLNVTEPDLLHALDAVRAGREPVIQRHVQQLRRIAKPPKQRGRDEEALLQAVLAGFPDRVARRRAGKQVLLSTGGSAEMTAEGQGNQFLGYEFMVAVDAEDRKDKPLPLIRMTARVEPEWLVDLFPERVRERVELEWNAKAGRVEAVSRLLYDELVIEESRGARPDAEPAAAMLAHEAVQAGVERFVDAAALEQLLARAEFAGGGVPDVESALREICAGLVSFAELRAEAKHLLAALEQRIAGGRLRELAPVAIKLVGGRQTKVHYERGKPPWIASRLQDFFGMRETPRIGRERTPVVVHLLAPNHRPVQMTTDLAGFWERLYPQVRRELMRRYPRHSWPEKV